MNQTVTINISGIVFHIEIDAYEDLKKYLNKIKSYFNNSEEREEIMIDIESRIAELFGGMMNESNQVITSENVAKVIETMGKPEQYIDEETEEEQQHTSTENSHSRTGKKLFRDPDDRILGGVASGLAAYFGFDAVWMRLLFILFTFMGFGILTYIILWIVMTEAKTASDKLKMKGDPVNVDNIGRTIEEEAKKVNERIKNVNTQKFGQYLESFFGAIGQIFKVIFNIAGSIIGFAFLVVGIFLAVGFIAGLSGSEMIYAITSDGIFSIESSEFFNLIFVTENQFHLAVFGIILLIGIPIVTIIYGGIKILFKVKTHYSFGIALTVFWLIGIAICTLIGIKMGAEMSSSAKIVTTQTLPSKYNSFNLTATNEDIPGNGILEGQFSTVSLGNDKFYLNDVSLNIYKSKTDSTKLVITKYSNGESKKAARTKAKNITYSYAITDSTINLTNYISAYKDDKIRGQHVRIKLYLPKGKSAYLNPSIKDVMYDIDNVTNTWDGDMLGKEWVMLKNGLTCLECEDIEGTTKDKVINNFPKIYNKQKEPNTQK